MLKNLFLCTIAFFLVFATILLLFPSSPWALASTSVTVGTAPTPTPDANAVVNSANDAVSRAQDILSVVNAFAAVLAVVLAFFGVLAGVLAFLGVRSYREVLSLTQELRNSLASVRAEGDKTREALVYLALGDRLLSQKNTAEALAIYQNAESLLPNDAQLQYVLGRIYSGAGDYKAAIIALEASYKVLEATHPQEDIGVRKEKAQILKELGLAYRRRATALNQDDDYEQALRCLEKSLSYNRQDSDALGILGGLYRRKKAYMQAYETYKEAYDVNPRSSYALGNLASLSWYQGKVDDAREYFHDTERLARKLLEKGEAETFWNHYDLALAQLAQGKTNEAKQTYALAISETPSVAQFEGVIDNLKLLKQAPQPMTGLNDVIKMVEDALKTSNNREKSS